VGKEIPVLLHPTIWIYLQKEVNTTLAETAKILDINNLPPMLTALEVGQILRIPRRRLYEELDAMGIPYKKLSPRRIRIPRDGFLKWLEGNKEGA